MLASVCALVLLIIFAVVVGSASNKPGATTSTSTVTSTGAANHATTSIAAKPGKPSPESTPPSGAPGLVQTGCGAIDGLESEIQMAQTQGAGTAGSVATARGSDLSNILAMSGTGGTNPRYRQIGPGAEAVSSAFTAWAKGSSAAALNGALAALANDCVAAGLKISDG